jgi:FtsZ-interacting cell division protein ZipA
VTTFIVIAVIVLVVIGVAAYVIGKRNREANIARADQLRTKAATQARSTLPPTQVRAAEAEAKAEEARAAAERAEAEAEEARVAAAQAEAQHEGQVRAADRLDPRVDHKADDNAPQVGGTVDQQPTPPAEVNAGIQPTADDSLREEPTGATATDTPAQATAEPTPESAQDGGTAPTLPQRTRGAQEMPGKPIETDGSGGWFTRKDTDRS